MLELAVIFLRLLQYAGAVILMGSPLFLLYALPRSASEAGPSFGWSQMLTGAAAAALLVSAVLSVGAQASVLAGSLSEGLKPEILTAFVTSMDLGRATAFRGAIAALALALIVLLPSAKTRWCAAAVFGTLATASLAWMSHGAATEGPEGYLHLGADILHSLAAAVWIGALVPMLILVWARDPSDLQVSIAHHALRGFSYIGTVVVAVLIASGLINTWFLVGLESFSRLVATPYSQLLVLKLALFGAMLALAAANRFRLTPALAYALQDSDRRSIAMSALRRSIAVEAALGAAILALVAWLGTLAPPSAL